MMGFEGGNKPNITKDWKELKFYIENSK